MKSIYETLAALGTTAIFVAGCGGSEPKAASPDVPAAVETTPQGDKPAEPTEQSSGDDAASDAAKEPAKDTENAMAAPAPSMSSTAAASAAPATNPKAAPKPAAKTVKTGTKTTAKKDGAQSCGEGTCA